MRKVAHAMRAQEKKPHGVSGVLRWETVIAGAGALLVSGGLPAAGTPASYASTAHWGSKDSVAPLPVL